MYLNSSRALVGKDLRDTNRKDLKYGFCLEASLYVARPRVHDEMASRQRIDL